MSFSEEVLRNIPELEGVEPANYSSGVQDNFFDITELLPGNNTSNIANDLEVASNTAMDVVGVPNDVWQDAEIVEDTPEEAIEESATMLASEEEEEVAAPAEGSIESQVEEVISPEEEDPQGYIAEQYSRFKGASWFDIVRTKQVTLAGLGGIGSWLSLYISRLGVRELELYDPDHFEAINMAGQLCETRSMGTSKVRIATQIAQNFSNFRPYPIQSRFDNDSFGYPIMMCGFDNMAARKTFFEVWQRNLRTAVAAGNNPRDYLLMDGRLTAEIFQIFTIQGDDEWAQREYKEKWLFSDAEADDEDCTLKQTSHIAAMIGANMTNIFTNWCSNQSEDNFPRRIPFMHSYNSVLNTHKYVY